MKTILVPTDFSKSAYIAAHFAIELAHISKAKIILLNTFNIPIPPPDTLVTPISFSELHEERLVLLKKMADIELRINKNYPDLNIDYEATMGGTVSEIIDAAKKYNVDMIVMGTHGASGIFKNIVGTNTASVIDKAPCPVFAIPDNAKFQGFRKITFAVDFSEIYPHDSLTQFLELVSIFKSEVNLLQVISKPEQRALIESEIERIKLTNIFQNIPHSFHIVLEENTSHAIENFINKTKTDVLATMPHKHNFFEFLFNKSVTHELVFHISKPLLCLPFHEKKT